MSPFQATKDWALNNTDNSNLLLYESTGSDDGVPIAFEYVDYDSGIGLPVTNSQCDIALETQDSDRVIFREGENVTGPFYPDTDPTNPDGTYKRSIYHQIKASFYNDYRDFTKLLGIEKLDFELSKTKRRLEDNIKMFDIPRVVFGDKIIPNTVEIPSNTLDNNFIITDDGNGNLYAGINLFSKQQEIGDFYNVFVSGSSFDCSTYFILDPPPTPIELSASVSCPVSNLAILTWLTSSNSPVEDGFIIERSDNAIPFVIIGIVGSGILTFNDYTLLSGHSYSYRVYAYTTFDVSGYSNTASVVGPSAPAFTIQPQDIWTNVGNNVSFNATTFALYPEVTYQWQIKSLPDFWESDVDLWDYMGIRFGPTYWNDSSSVNSVWTNLIDNTRITGSYTSSLISGTNTVYLTINNVALTDSASYRVIAANCVGEVTSSEAVLHFS